MPNSNGTIANHKLALVIITIDRQVCVPLDIYYLLLALFMNVKCDRVSLSLCLFVLLTGASTHASLAALCLVLSFSKASYVFLCLSEQAESIA